MPLKPTRRPKHALRLSGSANSSSAWMCGTERERPWGLREQVFGNAVLYTHHTAPHHTRRRFPSPCFSLALAAEQMAQMPLTGRGCLQGANVGRGFPSPLALVPADHTSRPALGHSRLLFTCRCVSVFGA